jgi:REP element-mobilizing transposase RayT
VYNRFARGESVFADPEEAIAFVELLRDVKQRDGLTILAWAVLSNHFHLAVRTSAIPLSRTMKHLQGTYSRTFNRRWRRSGPLWQSRYQARLVEDQQYLDQVIIYIHLNPVRAGLVDDSADYRLCGHRELLGKVRSPLADVDDALICFGDTVRRARQAYRQRIRAALGEDADSDSSVGGFRLMDMYDRDLEGRGGAFVDEQGRSTGLERPRLEAAEFLTLACESLGTEMEFLASTRRDRTRAQLRVLVTTVGIERWGQRSGALAPLLRKHPDAVSRWVREGAQRRLTDPEFSNAMDDLDVRLRREAIDRVRRNARSRN